MVVLDAALMGDCAHEGYLHAGDTESRRLAKQAAFKRSRVFTDAMKLLETSPEKSLDVLELPCGSGAHTEWLAKTFPSVRKIAAVDFSASLLRDARQRCAGLGDRVEFFLADGTRLADYPEFVGRIGTFDLCVSIMFFEHLPGRDARVLAAQAVRRCLKPNGRIFSSECSSALLQFLPESGAFTKYYREYCRLQNQDLAGDADMGIKMARLLEDAGFRVSAEPTVVSFCRRRSSSDASATRGLGELCEWAIEAMFSCKPRLLQLNRVTQEEVDEVARYLNPSIGIVQSGLYGLVNTVGVASSDCSSGADA